MRTIFKRIAAYTIDIILVAIIATLISSNSYINKDYDKYTKKQEEYKNIYDEYIKEIDELKVKLEKDDIKKAEYDKKEAEYAKSLQDYQYEILKLSVVPTLISVLCSLMYFVVIQFYFEGKTLGKFLMKIRVVSNNGKSLTIGNYFIRALIVYELAISLLNVIFIMFLSKTNYLIYNQVIYFINYLLEMIIIFSIMYNKNHRGIHDIISNTKVVNYEM